MVFGGGVADSHEMRKLRAGGRDAKRYQWQCRIKSCGEEKNAERAPLCPKHQRRMIEK